MISFVCLQELECVRLGKKKMHENPKLIFSEIT
jgi:hypothetical protein